MVQPVHTHIPGRALLGPQSHVALLRGALVVEVRECWQAQGAVPRGVEAQGRGDAVTQVHARIEAEAVVDGRIALSHKAHREGEGAQDEALFGVEAHVAAPVVEVVVPRGECARLA